MQKQIQRVFTSIRERTCVGYAKIATIGGFCGVDHIIVKATSPDDFPLRDKYVHDLLKIFSLSPSSHSAFALAFARRFRQTNSWRVALKCLLLLHLLLKSLPNDSPVWAEILWTRTNEVLSLHPCNFRDCSSSASEDYTAYVSSYARLLDEALDCLSIEAIQEQQIPCDDEEEKSTPLLKIIDLERMMDILPHLQSLIDRTIDCWPIGAASKSFLVHSSMRHVIHYSFTCYVVFRREIVKVLDNFNQLPYRGCVAAFSIYKKAAIQAHQFSGYHQWCKSMGYCGPHEHPIIDQIPDVQIRVLETILNEMWQLTDQSSPSNISSQTSSEQSPLRFTEDDGDKQVVDTELEPLIVWEVESTWEDLLEASLSSKSCMDLSYDRIHGNHDPYYHHLQTPNPFYQHQQRHTMNIYYGSCPNTPLHPWVI
ncbi:hypothetical protein ACS0TY_011490 [Phlomoides rotata]